MTQLAENVARKLGLGTVRLHGGVPTPARGKLLDRFRDNPDTQVFLSTDAGGVGLNLQAASVLVNLDLPWNPAVLDQRTDDLAALARRKLAAGEALLAQGQPEEAVALLAAAMTAAIARAAGATQPPKAADLAVWLYGEAVPGGAVDADVAGQVLRADAVARAQSVPPEPAEENRRDARALVLP